MVCDCLVNKITAAHNDVRNAQVVQLVILSKNHEKKSRKAWWLRHDVPLTFPQPCLSNSLCLILENIMTPRVDTLDNTFTPQLTALAPWFSVRWSRQTIELYTYKAQHLSTESNTSASTILFHCFSASSPSITLRLFFNLWVIFNCYKIHVPPCLPRLFQQIILAKKRLGQFF